MKKMLLTLIAIISLAGAAGNANATISSVSVNPSSRNIGANTPAIIPASWTANRAGGVGSVTVSSPSVVIRLGSVNGPILLTTSKSLSKTQTIVNNNTPYIFSEAITVPRNVVYTATKAGQPLVIVRIFTDQSDAGVNTGVMQANISGGNSADFGISQVTLTFDDGSSSCVSKAGKKRTALARINASGTGIIRGAWQVRSGGGLGSFRTLRTVQVSASGNTIIQSPSLPTAAPGERMEVRLAIESPELNFPIPSISCGISGENSVMVNSDKEQQTVKVISPAPNSPINSETEIKWEAVKGAKAYRIEILADENGTPVAAQLAKPENASAKISPLTLEKLDVNGRYIVRVVAE
jgi:hypothetical protein